MSNFYCHPGKAGGSPMILEPGLAPHARRQLLAPAIAHDRRGLAGHVECSGARFPTRDSCFAMNRRRIADWPLVRLYKLHMRTDDEAGGATPAPADAYASRKRCRQSDGWN